MSFKHKRIILTGAAGGIGRHIARNLLDAGANVLAVDLAEGALQELEDEVGSAVLQVMATDITSQQNREEIVKCATDMMSRVDILINGAGINPFGAFHQQSAQLVETVMQVNMIAPMALTQLVLTGMLAQKQGQIVNIGSAFGSIGFAWFVAYSASKFGVRGFSQALRRELVGTGVDVTYIAPRAVKTGINSQAVYEMAASVKMNMDEPAQVAQEIVAATALRKKECYIGFPESLFARVNAVLPGLVDISVKKQNSIAREFALQDATV